MIREGERATFHGRSGVCWAGILKSVRLEPGKPRGFNEAVVAAGGVDIDEIDCTTMESRHCKNLYITGELLDIDGDSGGYNLQFAWSTGAIAGMAQHNHDDQIIIIKPRTAEILQQTSLRCASELKSAVMVKEMKVLFLLCLWVTCPLMP